MKELARALACIGLGSMLLLGIFIVAADPFATVGDNDPTSVSWPSSRNYTDVGLDCGQIFCSVRAVNAESEGSNLNEFLQKPAAVPGAPRNLVALPGDAQATLTWAAPSKDGGSPITSYNVYRGTTSNGEVVITSLGNVLTFTNTGLTNGQTYFYQVSAANSVGEGAMSNEALVTPSSVPSAPTLITAAAGNSYLELTWSAPAEDGVEPITAYNLYRGIASNGESLLNTLGNVLSFTDTGLTNDQTYYYRISAVNFVGEGPQSNEVSATPGTVPTAPRNLLAAAGDAVVDLSWTAPSYVGPGTLVYHLFRDGSQIWNGIGLTYSDIFVNNRITYHYQMAASNSIGYGVNCTAVPATPMSDNHVPTAPNGLTATPSSSLIYLNWTAPSYLGPGTISYHLFRDGTLIWNGSAMEYNDASALSFVEYSYKVAAQNSLGWGPNSTEVHAALTTSPGMPTNFKVIASGPNINLSWAPPMNSGSMPILGYKVYRMDNSVMTLLQTVTSGTNYTDIAASNGEMYYYQIRAFNSIGDGAVTAILSPTLDATQADPIVFGPDVVLYVGIGAISAIVLVDVALIIRRRNK